MEARGVWSVPVMEKELWVSERMSLHSGCSVERRRERSFCLLMADTKGTAPAESADTDGTAPAESALLAAPRAESSEMISPTLILHLPPFLNLDFHEWPKPEATASSSSFLTHRHVVFRLLP